MGRHRPAWKKTLDIKSKLFFLSRAVTMGQPFLRRFFSFYPATQIPDSARMDVLHRSSYHYPWLREPYAAARQFVFTDNVDSQTRSTWTDTQSTERFVAIIRDVIIPGPLVTPVDPQSGTLISSEANGPVTWNRARPSLAWFRKRRVSADLTIAIPRASHFGHLLTDVLMPAFFALQTVGFTQGRKLNVVTSQKPVPLITAFIQVLGAMGYEVTHVTAQTHETVIVPRLLYGATHTSNLELKFATPECLDAARRLFLAVLPAPSMPRPKRIFLHRGKTRTRQVAGEAELAERLEQIGFVSMTGTWANLSDQISFFHEAETIVTVHGAGMANILWSSPKARLIEISAHDKRKSTGLHWASAVGADYLPLTGSNEQSLQNFSIDPDAMFERIREEIGDLSE